MGRPGRKLDPRCAAVRMRGSPERLGDGVRYRLPGIQQEVRGAWDCASNGKLFPGPWLGGKAEGEWRTHFGS